eukprot:2842584-Rhodomonas_salina.1
MASACQEQILYTNAEPPTLLSDLRHSSNCHSESGRVGCDSSVANHEQPRVRGSRGAAGRITPSIYRH